MKSYLCPICNSCDHYPQNCPRLPEVHACLRESKKSRPNNDQSDNSSSLPWGEEEDFSALLTESCCVTVPTLADAGIVDSGSTATILQAAHHAEWI